MPRVLLHHLFITRNKYLEPLMVGTSSSGRSGDYEELKSRFPNADCDGEEALVAIQIELFLIHFPHFFGNSKYRRCIKNQPCHSINATKRSVGEVRRPFGCSLPIYKLKCPAFQVLKPTQCVISCCSPGTFDLQDLEHYEYDM